MSKRNNSQSKPSKEQIAKAFTKSFIDLVENFINEDAHLDVVHKCITALFETMTADDRALVLKKILMHFMRKFPIEFEDKTQKPDTYIQMTLELWRIFGKCSKTMGPIGILEKIEDSYVGCWQYYKIYAEALIEEDCPNSEKLYTVFRNCIEHCELSDNQVRNIFGPKVMSFVKCPEPMEEDEGTVQFMQARQNNVLKSLAARRRSSFCPQRLTAILESNDENMQSRPMSSASNYKTPASNFSQKQVVSLKTVSPKRVQKPAVAIQDTIVINDETTVQKPVVDEFSVFKDPSIVPGQRRVFNAAGNSPTVCGTHMHPKDFIDLGEPLTMSTPEGARKPKQFKPNM